VIGILGVLEDAANVLIVGFSQSGDVIILLDGLTGSAPVTAAASGEAIALLRRDFSSSEYSKTIGSVVAGQPPAIDLAAEKRLQQCLIKLASSHSVQSAHDLSDGGLPLPWPNAASQKKKTGALIT